MQVRTWLRLRLAPGPLESFLSRNAAIRFFLTIVRFHETINGRAYVIEASPVGPDRWRAQIARQAGATTAVMPFYGQTPDEAARQLSGWLTRAAGKAT